MHRLNMAFVAEYDDESSFFIWLTNRNGSFARQHNRHLQFELCLSPLWQRLFEKYPVKSGALTMEKEKGSVDTEGLFLPLTAVFDMLMDHAYFRALPEGMEEGASCRFFKEIAEGIGILLKNGHFHPNQIAAEKDGHHYVASHWVLDKELLRESGAITEWLHHIPEEVLLPRVIAQHPLRRWLSALLDCWSDALIRRILQKYYSANIQSWPDQDFYGSEAAAWVYHLVQGDGGFYHWTNRREDLKAVEAFQASVHDLTGSKGRTDDLKQLAAFKSFYIKEWIEPLSLGIRLEPQDRDNPFSYNGEWEAELVVEGIKGDQEQPEWITWNQVLSAEPVLADWVFDRLETLIDFNPALEEIKDWGTAVLETEEVMDLYSHRDRFSEQAIAFLFPSWMKIRDKRRESAKLNVSVTNPDGAFGFDSLVDFNWRLSLGDIDVSADTFERLVREQQRFFRSGDTWIELPLDQLNAIYSQVRRAGGSLKAKGRVADAFKLQLSQDESSVSAVDLRLAPAVDQFFHSLTQSSVPNASVPADLHGELRPYQKKGYAWLVQLHDQGVGACLADDMGLGKTIQTIAYLLKTKDHHPGKPALIICPTSVVGNWAREMATFAPSLNIYLHHGAGRWVEEDFNQHKKAVDVVITSYALTVKDADWLKKQQWSSLILDEAQAIKNPAAKKSQVLRTFRADHRIALTGTPIENRLDELWSIMDFLNPGYLGSLAAFRREFINPIERKRDESRSNQLKRLIQPFLLRREKTDKRIIDDLPDKNETKVYCHLSEAQASLYQSVVEDLTKKMQSAAGIRRKGLILSTLTRLKQVCDHPDLLIKTDKVQSESGKLRRFFELIDPILRADESVLVFTQYVKMGKLLSQVIAEKHPECPLYFLHGSVPANKREDMIQSFQSENGRGVFILSLKAGGFGLNLTSANHVVHYDRWWNPAVEEQATDRTYRIGQARDVHVYKLISEGTLEKRIDELIEKKKGLANQILGSGEQWVTEMNDQEILDLIRLRRQVLA
ncbi:DEAD/DEAH box helicase [Camelliibacillus cellulosilyticus]|uniref:DEAD/DEAH box helicase n=1 Tax=Camelliibacillus cellulosilyticus TaxID=2174486 RepID=A0ABV9GKY3_9BACL